MAVSDQAVVTPTFTMTVEGTDIPPDARGDVTRIVVEDSVDRAGTFAIELDNWDDDAHTVTWSDKDLFAPGKAVDIRLGYTDGVASVMKGEVTGLELSFPPHAHSLVTVRGFDRLHRFRRGRRTKTYLQAKDSDVAKEIADALGLDKKIEDSTEVHPYLLQSNQTDIDFLLDRARAIGYEVLVDDKELTFRKVKSGLGKVETFSFTKGLIKFDAYLSTADQPGGVTVRGWDPKAKQAVVGTAEPNAVTGTMGGKENGPAAAKRLFKARPLAIVDFPVSSQKEAELLAQGLLNEIALDYIVADVVIEGNPQIAVGSVIEVDDVGKRFSGLYYTTRAAHIWDGAYLTHLTARRNAA
jgi:phage protein D